MKRFVSSHRIEVSGTCSSSFASEFKSKKFRSCLIDSQIFRGKIVFRTEQHPSIHRHVRFDIFHSQKSQNVPALPLCIFTSCPPQDVQPVLLLMLLMHNISVQILKLPCIMINDQKTGRTEDTRDEISSRGPKILFFKPRILSQSLLLCGGGHSMSRGGIQ